MHVVLKPFIKLFLIIIAVLGVAKLAGVDVDGLMSEAKEKLDDFTSQQAAEE